MEGSSGEPLLDADGEPPGGLACGSFGLSRGSVLNSFEPQTAATLSPRLKRNTWGMFALARYVVVFGGWDTDPVRRYNDVHVLDTVTWTWHAAGVVGDAPSARSGHTACTVRVDGGKHAVLVLHGQEEDERLCADAHLLMLE